MTKLTKVMITSGTFSRRNIADPTESGSPSSYRFEAEMFWPLATQLWKTPGARG
jgi:hypothetical protein